MARELCDEEIALDQYSLSAMTLAGHSV